MWYSCPIVLYHLTCHIETCTVSFGFFSDIIGQVFFPPSSTVPTSSTGGEYYDDNLLKSFAVFGSAFLMRPFGGMIIGYLGDKYGRKYALVLSLFLMAVPTFIMGCLPTYEQVGALSTVLLVLCRLLQGISVGGQLPASLIYTVETRPKERWGMYGSFVMMAANLGSLLGNIAGATTRSALTTEQLRSWGWRIPFWSGLLIAGVALYLKLHGEEHHPNAGEYDSEHSEGQEKPKHPLREAVRKENLPALIAATLTPMLGGYVPTIIFDIRYFLLAKHKRNRTPCTHRPASRLFIALDSISRSFGWQYI